MEYYVPYFPCSTGIRFGSAMTNFIVGHSRPTRFHLQTLTFMGSRFFRSCPTASVDLRAHGQRKNENYVAGDANDPACYKSFVTEKPKLLQARLDDPKRFQHVSERKERSLIRGDAARSMTAAPSEVLRRVPRHGYDERTHAWTKTFCRNCFGT